MYKLVFILMFIMGVFSPLINAYEYLYFDMPSNEGSNNAQYQFFVDSDGRLKNKFVRGNGQILIQDSNFIAVLGQIQRSNGGTIITKNVLNSYFYNDLQFLNDFYTQKLDAILNYFYNHDYYNATNYIHYENYELLYNSDGLVVESIVNGVWAGLYDDGNKRSSGRLYSRTGQLLYVNGVSVQNASLFDVINELLIVSVMDVFGVYARSMVYLIYFVIVIVFVAFFSIVYFVGGGLYDGSIGSDRKRDRWIATFTAGGVRKGSWHKYNPDNYHYQSGHRNFSDYRDYVDYERGLSNGTREPIKKRRIF